MRYRKRTEDVRFALLLALLASCFLMGGASRVDVLSLIVLQPLAVLLATAIILLRGPFDWRIARVPLLLLCGIAAVMVAQLIPLPPAVWTHLPGHAPFAASATVAGIPQPWRPISLTPDLTMASLVGLVVPLAVLIGCVSIEQQRLQSLHVTLLAGCAASAVFALIQLSAVRSPAYLYDITNFGNGVGLFANRNHQAVLIAMAWPLLAVWAASSRGDPRRRTAIRWIATAFALFLVPLLLVTGSRAGLVLGAIGLGAGALIWRLRPGQRTEGATDMNRVPAVAVAGGGVLLVAMTIFLSRAEAVQRMLSGGGSQEMRVEAAPTLVEIARAFWTVGSGFGSFDPLFRTYEPLSMLSPEYLNHAHNDLLELVITGGAPALLITLIFVFWWARCSVRVWRSRDSGIQVSLARAASVMIGLLLLSSLVDYPLRTPLMMAIFGIACVWLGALRQVRSAPSVQMRAA